MDFIRLLADAKTLETMSIGDKLTAGLMVAVIGMTITFIALMFIMAAINIMSRLLASKKETDKIESTDTPVPAAATVDKKQTDDLELVAVITAALAASLGKPANQIVVKNIVRISDQKPAWARQGLAEQINQHL